MRRRDRSTYQRGAEFRQAPKPLGQRIKHYCRITLAVLCVVCVYFVVMKFNHAYPIKHVSVKGDYTHTAASAIQKAVAPHLSRGFFTVRLSKIREACMTLPWMKSVVVRKSWPDVIELVLQEKVAVAVWNDRHLLTADAEVFTPATLPDLGVVELSGPQEKAAEVLSTYNQMAKILAKTDLSIDRLVLSDRLAWRLTTNSGMILELGTREPRVRLQRFAKTYRQVFKNNQKFAKHIDLRYPNGYAIKWGKS